LGRASPFINVLRPSSSHARVAHNTQDAGKDSDRDYLGTHRWDPELLSEARGDFLQMRVSVFIHRDCPRSTVDFTQHADLLRILYDAALREPSRRQTNGHTSRSTVTIEFGAEVVDADFDACSVTLRSGVVHRGDVLIGADGASGFIRQRLLTEEDEPADDEFNGLAVYRSGHTFHPSELRDNDSATVQLFPRGLRSPIRSLKNCTSILRCVLLCDLV
jgi:2-polyprenyl-6-methoxyphenol hydroxylase-like FAD-dependent oxidoreductase